MSKTIESLVNGIYVFGSVDQPVYQALIENNSFYVVSGDLEVRYCPKTSHVKVIQYSPNKKPAETEYSNITGLCVGDRYLRAFKREEFDKYIKQLLLIS